MHPTLETRQILSLAEVISLTKISRSSIYVQLKAGSFPPPLRLGRRRIGWRLSDLDEWMSSPARHWDAREDA